MDFRSFCLAIGGFGELPAATLRPSELLTAKGRAAISDLSPYFSELDHAWQSYLRVASTVVVASISPAAIASISRREGSRSGCSAPLA